MHAAGKMNMKQPAHKTDGSCRVECNPPAKGGPSLGSVMKQKGNTGAQPGEKHHARGKVPMKAGGGPTEQ